MLKGNRKQVLILSLTLVVVMLGFGMVMPIFPFYIEHLGGGGSELGLLVATSAFMELLCGPIWGSVSDRTGRKPILMLGMLGYSVSLVLFGLSTKLWMFFASRALSGVLSSATMSTALAYIGDSTAEEDRGGGMGILGAAMGLGVILGPSFGGWLGAVSLSTPFFVAAGLSLVSLLLIGFLLPESLPAEARQQAGKVRVIQFSQLWRALFSPIGLLLVLIFLLSFGLANFEAVFGLYALQKYAFGPEQVGMILTVVGVVSTGGKVFTGALTRRWGDAPIVKVSLLTGSVGFAVLLLANTYVTILLATGFFVLSKTFLRPSLLSLISKRASVGQGAAMGLSNSFMSLGRIGGPIWAGLVFDVHVDYPYVSGAVIMFIGFLVSLVWVTEAGKVGVRGPQYSQEAGSTPPGE